MAVPGGSRPLRCRAGSRRLSPHPTPHKDPTKPLLCETPPGTQIVPVRPPLLPEVQCHRGTGHTPPCLLCRPPAVVRPLYPWGTPVRPPSFVNGPHLQCRPLPPVRVVGPRPRGVPGQVRRTGVGRVERACPQKGSDPAPLVKTLPFLRESQSPKDSWQRWKRVFTEGVWVGARGRTVRSLEVRSRDPPPLEGQGPLTFGRASTPGPTPGSEGGSATPSKGSSLSPCL